MKLLIIDHDNVCNCITAWAARRSGIFNDVQVVKNGLEALDIAARMRSGAVSMPELIILELDLPGINAFDLLKSIKALASQTKKPVTIAILTSSDDPGDFQRVRAIGIDNYLLKSLTLKELQSSLFSLYRKAKRKTEYHRPLDTAAQSNLLV